MKVKAEVLRLLQQIRRANPESVFPKATQEIIANSEGRLGFPYPPQYREFLTCCNGAQVGEVAIYGIKTEKPFFDIEQSLPASPQFKRWRMLPIAGDGCGNFYLLDAASTDEASVYFFDTISDDRPGYVVASDFWHFAYFYITEPMKKRGWPWRRKYVLKVDPKLAKPFKAPPLWET